MKQFFLAITALFKCLSNYNFDFLFYFAAFTLPFENLFFAPSTGWATITPLILFLYAVLNLYPLQLFSSKLLPIFYFFLGFGLLGTLTTIIFHGRLDDYLAALVPIVLGLSCLFGLLAFYAKNQTLSLKRKLNLLVSIIIISYLLAILVGLLEFFTLKYQLSPVSDFFNLLFKRNYLAKSRIQFFFTEPSFIGMHLFGILLPLFWLSRRTDLLFLLVLFIYSAIFFGAGVRIILDLLIIILLLSFYYLKKSKQKLFLPLFAVSFLILITSFSQINGRFHKIFFGFIGQQPDLSIDCDLPENATHEECLAFARQSGINSDGSFASRVFRIQSSLFGYSKSPFGFLTGYGLGNSIYPVRLGHTTAKKSYKSSYLKEVNDLIDPNYHDDSVSYCLYTRVISEFGIFALLFGLFYLLRLAQKSSLDYKYFYLLIILYLYLQFESLSFYALWLYIAVMLINQLAPNLDQKPKTHA